MIHVEQLSKRFMIYPRPLTRLWDWLTPARLHRGRPFWALRELTFDVPAGSSTGVVGVNGAGKSTLLKILTGTMAPTAGRYGVQGRVASLLELGTGFHPDFTGRQNIFFGGKMAGLDDAELAAKFDQIVEFSELGEFIEQPVRTYSSGMLMRLGFALASSVDPDVMIIDEALSVGDIHFQQKCLRRMRQFHERGTTVLFVSHDPSMVKTFCNEAILLDAGRIVDRGTPDKVLDYYTALLAEKYRDGGRRAKIIRPIGAAGASPAAGAPTPAGEDDDEPPAAPLEWSAGHRTGNFQAVITSVTLKAFGAHGNSNILVTGAPATICVRAVALERIESVTLGIAIKDRLGQEIFGTNTNYREVESGPLEPGRVAEASFAMPMNLGPGLYTLTVAAHAGASHIECCYDWVEQALAIQILPNPLDRFTGLCRLEPVLRLKVAPASAREQAFAEQTRARLARNAEI